MSPVWFSGSFDYEQWLTSIGLGGLFGSAFPSKVYSTKDAAGNHKKLKLGGYGRSGVIGGVIMAGVSMAETDCIQG